VPTGAGQAPKRVNRAMEELWDKRLNERRRVFELRSGTCFSMLQLVRFEMSREVALVNPIGSADS
jgi:hypothetical protein